LKRLESYGAHFVYPERPESLDEKIRCARDADILINTRGIVAWPGEVLRELPKLRMIASCSIGTDMIDLEAARELGITVCNQPGLTAPVVAEHAFALMLAVAKRAAFMTEKIKAGQWPSMDSYSLQGKTIGIIGTGNTGCEMARLSKAFGMEVIAWTFNPSREKAHRLGFRYVELDELLQAADVVSLHLKLTEDSRHFLGKREFTLMKPDSLLVNCARGDLVETGSLVEALEMKHLGGAGLDVFDEEPLSANHPLLGCEHVVLTPHGADMTAEGNELLIEGAVDNIIAFLEGNPRNVVS
jgi:D-3-phosphoglycerate dehydrogenase